MRNVGRKKITVAVLVLSAVALLGMGCSFKPPVEWGKVLKYGNAGSLYYTSGVTEEEARRLGDYLLKIGFFRDNEPVIAQLTRKGGEYHLYTVADKKAIEEKRAPNEMDPVEAAGLLAEDISKDVFNGVKVEWHLCDDKLKTIRVGSISYSSSSGDTIANSPK